jgi:hypothetical protein
MLHAAYKVAIGKIQGCIETEKGFIQNVADGLKKDVIKKEASPTSAGLDKLNPAFGTSDEIDKVLSEMSRLLDDLFEKASAAKNINSDS